MRNWLVALGGIGLASCNGLHSGTSAEVALLHQHDAAYQQQVALLQADDVRLEATHPVESGADFYLLSVHIKNPKNQPQAPDSLRQRTRRLACVVVADLAQPAKYKAVNVQVTYQKGWLPMGGSTATQSFIYPLATLQHP